MAEQVGGEVCDGIIAEAVVVPIHVADLMDEPPLAGAVVARKGPAVADGLAPERDDVDGSDVMVVAPTSLATSYILTQHALTVIRVDSLSTAVRTQLADELDDPVDTFEFIQIGKWTRDSPNHSLTEFANA